MMFIPTDTIAQLRRLTSIKTRMGKNPCSSILKLLQLHGIGFNAVPPNNVTIIEIWLYYCIICAFQGFSRSKEAEKFYGTDARSYFLDICAFHARCLSTCTQRDLVVTSPFIWNIVNLKNFKTFERT